MSIQPVNLTILVDPLPDQSKVFATGYHQQWGKVAAVSPPTPFPMGGKFMSSPIEVGEYVYMSKAGMVPAQTQLDILQGGVKSYLIHYLDVLLKTMDFEKFTPIGNYVLLALEQPPEDSIISTAALHQPNKGKVVSLGTGMYLMDGTLAPFVVEVGDTVYFDVLRLSQVRLDSLGTDKNLYLISQSDIYGKEV